MDAKGPNKRKMWQIFWNKLFEFYGCNVTMEMQMKWPFRANDVLVTAP